MMSELACFTYRLAELPLGGNLSGHQQLFEKLREHAVTPLISLAAEAAFNDDTLPVHELVDEQVTRETGQIGLETVAHPKAVQ